MRRTNSLIVLCVLSTSFLAAQYRVDVWTTDNGLPQNSVNAIVQSHDGFLWLGTFGGLARFDGYTIKKVDEKKFGFPSNRILALAEDGKGVLWVGTEDNGLVRFEGETTRVYTTREGLLNNAIGALSVGSDGSLWIGTPAGVQRMVNGVLQDFRGVANAPVRDVVRINHDPRTGAVWISCRDGLYVYGDGTFRIAVRPKQASPYIPMLLCFDGEDNAWVREDNDVIATYAPGSLTPFKRSRTGETGFVEIMLHDNSGMFWAGLNYRGLQLVSFGQSPRIEEVINLPSGKTNFHLRAGIEDREGNFWFCSEGDGLIRIRKQFITNIGLREGLSNEIVEGLFSDSRGTLWIGTNCGGLNRYVRGTVTVYRDGSLNECVWSVGEDARGRIWVGTFGGGLYRWRDNRSKPFESVTAFPDDGVLSMLLDREKNFWFGSLHRGVYRLNGETFEHIGEGTGLDGAAVNTIVEDRAGTIWFGTRTGLFHYSHGTVASFTTANGLSHNHVRAVYEDRDGLMWVGTYGGGLNCVRPEGIVHISSKEGLYDDIISSLLEDEAGNFWISCNRGIFRVGRNELMEVVAGKRRSVLSVVFGKNDGLRNLETNGGFQYAGLKTADGQLLFPTVQGIAVIDPHSLPEPSSPPTAVVEQLLVNDEDVSLRHSFEGENENSRIELRFTAVSLSDAGKLRFSYTMNAEDHPWIDAKDRRSAFFTNLPPGEYDFSVRAAFANGPWSEPSPAVHFVLLPPFWKSWWFITVSVSLAGAFGAGVTLRRRSVRDRQLSTERAYAVLVAESEKKYRTIFEESRDALFISTPGGKILDVNKAGVEIFGFGSKEEFLLVAEPKSIYGNLADRNRVLDALTAQGSIRDVEIEFKRKDGALLLGSISTVVVRDEQGVVTLRTSMRDITEWKRAETELRRNEELFRSLVGNIGELYFIVDAKGKISHGSPQFFAGTGYTPAEIIGKRFINLVAPEDQERVVDHFIKCFRENIVDSKIEFRGRRKSGLITWVEQFTRMVKDEKGGVKEFRNLVRDISDRKMEEERDAVISRLGYDLITVTQPSQAAEKVAAATEALFSWDSFALYLYYSEQRELFGLLRIDTLDGQRIKESPVIETISPPELMQRLGNSSGLILQGDDPDIASCGILFGRRSKKPTSAILSLVRSASQAIGVIAIQTHKERLYTQKDVDALQILANHCAGALDRIRADELQRVLYDEVRVTQERLHALSQRLLSMQEDERRFIAKELHDEIGQALTAIKINLQGLQRTSEDLNLNPQIRESITIVEQGLKQVRGLSLDLRPSLLDDLGLIPALRWYLDKIKERQQFSIVLQEEIGTIRLPQAIEVACFRIVQEALTNIAKYAEARSVQIRIELNSDKAELTVQDDGKGFDVVAAKSEAARGGSLGILGMEERAILAGGTFTLLSTVGSGTTLHATFVIGREDAPLKFDEPAPRTDERIEDHSGG